jgi:NAD+-dependent protein deacetylase SIR2
MLDGCYTTCIEDDQSKQGKRSQGQSKLQLRVWLYNDFGFPDEKAINKVKAVDIHTKPNAVIVVGTALKVDSAKFLAQDMCRTSCKAGGYTA